jgi:hypothetical protein
VKGGLYGEYPSLEAGKLLEGDLHYNNDFRGTYATLLERWMGLDAKLPLNRRAPYPSLPGRGAVMDNRCTMRCEYAYRGFLRQFAIWLYHWPW